MSKVTLKDATGIQSTCWNRLIFINVITAVIKIKVFVWLLFLFTVVSSFGQTNLPGLAPVSEPKGGLNIEGNAYVNSLGDLPTAGDWLFENGDDDPGMTPGGVFPPDASDGFAEGIPEDEDELPDDFYLYPGQTFLFRDNITNKDPTIFTSSNKINHDPETYTWGTGSAPQKNEIQTAIAHFSYADPSIPGGVAGDLWLMFAGDRKVTTGSSYIDFELLQKPLIANEDGTFTSQAEPGAGGRTPGDILVTIEFTNGGGAAQVVTRRWIIPPGETDYEYSTFMPVAGTIFGTENTVETIVPYSIYEQSEIVIDFDGDGINDPGFYQYSINQWAEGAVNVSSFFDTDPCFNLSTLFVRTRTSGNSDKSELKDFPGKPIQLDLDITPDITITDPDPVCTPNTVDLTADGIVDGCNGTLTYWTDENATIALNNPDAVAVSGTYYIKCTSLTSDECIDIESVDVVINNTPSLDLISPETHCDSYTLPAVGTITGSNLVSPKYYDDSQANNGNEITNLVLTSSQTVWVYDETGTTPNCSDEISFLVTINDTPELDPIQAETHCDSYTLPAVGTITGSNLVSPKYYDDSQANNGNEITNLVLTSSQTVWVYDETGTTPNCSDEISFLVTINDTPALDPIQAETHCDSYTLPAVGTITGSNLVSPKYYDDSQANNGNEITNLVLTSSQTVWVYDETGTTPNCSDEISFLVTINDTPALDPIQAETHCDSYTLPAVGTITGSNLVSPKYYDDSQANNGNEITNLVLTSSQTVWVYDETGTTPNCSDEISFLVTINDTPALDPIQAETHCDSYTLPAVGTITGSNLVSPKYYDDSQANNGNEITNLVLTSSQTVWVYDETGTTPNCSDEISFLVTINDTPALDPIQAETHCDSYTLPAVGTITGSNLVSPKYYDDSQANNGNEITNLVLTSSQTVWVYDETGTTPNCSDEISFLVTINDTPELDPIQAETHCDSYTLPAVGTITGSNLVSPKYYDDSQANNGNEITNLVLTSSQTVWVYDETGTTPNCSDEISFLVTINDTPELDPIQAETHCDSYTLPAVGTITGSNLVSPKYYDDSQANNGNEITNLVLTSSQTVWVYDETGTTPNCSDEISFLVTINDTPALDPIQAETHCDSYTLPAVGTITGSNLVSPKYYDDSQANNGNEITNLVLTSSQTVWVYDETGTTPNCSDEISFLVTINDTPALDPIQAETHCDSYTLPAVGTITGSNLVSPKYYDDSQANNGNEITNLVLTSSQTVWVYDETGTTPNCSDEISFLVTINDTPELDPIQAETHCDSYTLPAVGTITGSNLVSPKYYDDSQANNGNEITNLVLTSSQTVWVYDETGTTPNCSDEISFLVTINDTPALDPIQAETHCDSYTLPAVGTITGSNLVSPKYYDDSQANNGNEITNLVLTSSQTVWVYDETGTTPNCSDEISFLVTINDTPELDPIQAETHCDSYTLPAVGTITGSNLVSPKYYDDSQANNGNEITNLVLTSSQTVWVYDETGTTPNCSDEISFLVTINDTPELDPIQAVSECGSYTLPDLNTILGSSLVDPKYYDDSQANGGQEITDFEITSTQTIWVYDETGTTPNCTNEISFDVTIENCAHIFPTQTDCDEYRCIAQQEDAIDYTLKDICVTVKGPNIRNAVPGVFFYYADLFDVAGTTTTVYIDQTSDLTKYFLAQNTQNVRVYSAECGVISPTSITIYPHSDSNQGDVKISFNSIPGSDYIISVKYDVKTIIGGKLQGQNPVSSFLMKYNDQNGGTVSGSAGGFNLNDGNCVAEPVLNPDNCKSVAAAPAELASESLRSSILVQENGFSVAPVPFKDQVSLQYEFEYTSDVKIQFFDFNGSLLRTYADKQVSNGDVTHINIDFALKANQVYIIRLETDRDTFSKTVMSGN